MSIDTTVAPMGLTKRISEFFGKKENQTTSEFMTELKALTPADKEWFVAEFNKAGMPTALLAPAVK